MWEDILKNIQISSQRATSRNIVAPDEDEEVPDVEQEEEDCSQWWIDLMDLCDELLENWGGNKYRRSGYRGPIENFSRDELCQKKQEIINSIPQIINRYSNYKNKTYDKAVIRFGEIDSAFIRFICNSDDLDKVPTLEINIAINNKYIYHKIVNIDYKPRGRPSPLGKHIGDALHFSTFLLRSIRMFKDWKGSQNLEKSAIQIGSQKTLSRDLVKPDEDDEDCYKWWLELMSYINQMINGLDRNATLYQPNAIYSLPPDLVCFYKDALLTIDSYYYQSPYYRGFIRSSLDPPVSYSVYCRTDYTGAPPTFYAAITLGDTTIYQHKVKLLNDTFLRDLKSYNTYNKSMVYDFVRKFQDAEIKLKRHTQDNSDESIAEYVMQVYDSYFREEFDISKNISIGSQKTMTRRLVGPDDDKSCREELDELIDRILNYKTDLFEGPPTRSGAYFKSWVVGIGYESQVRKTNSLFLEAHYTRELDEETCCAILMAIDKYKSQDEVETEIRIPSADGYDEGVLVLSKEITESKMYYHLFMASGKYLAMTISINMHREAGIPDEEWDKVKRIFESR